MQQKHRAELSRQELFRDAAVALATVLLAFAAFDDITTDNDSNFILEWVVLAVCAVGLLIVSWRLLRSDHVWLGSVSLVVLVATVVAGSTIGLSSSPLQAAYLTIFAGLLWFLGLAATLTGLAWRRAAQPA